jgi:Flp pilus assembly protein TadD
MFPRLLSVRLVSALAITAFGVSAQVNTVGADNASATVVSPSIVVLGSVESSEHPNGAGPLPSDLRLEVHCHFYTYDGGGVKQSGTFNFTFTPNPTVVSAGVDCTIEAKAFGFDSTVAKFPSRTKTGVINVGTLTIQRNASGEAQTRNKERERRTVSATSLKAPPEAARTFDLGVRSLQQGKFAPAAKHFENAIKAYPEYAEAWLGLGRARVRLEAMGPAREAFLRSAELDPQLAGPPAELGLLAARENDLPVAARYLDEALRLDPGDSFQTCYSDAVVNLMLKRYDAAERAARSALAFGEAGPQSRADYVLGMALLAKGNGPAAKESLMRYLELNPKAPERDQVMKEVDRIDQIASRDKRP